MYFVIAFLNVKTRQVILSPATLHPNEEWSFARHSRLYNRPVLKAFPSRLTLQR